MQGDRWGRETTRVDFTERESTKDRSVNKRKSSKELWKLLTSEARKSAVADEAYIRGWHGSVERNGGQRRGRQGSTEDNGEVKGGLKVDMQRKEGHLREVRWEEEKREERRDTSIEEGRFNA